MISQNGYYVKEIQKFASRFNPKFLPYILCDNFGDFVKLPRVFQNALEHAERGGVVIAVAYALVEDKREVDVRLFVNSALCVKLNGTALCSEREEYGTGSEIIKVVINRGYAQRTH